MIAALAVFLAVHPAPTPDCRPQIQAQAADSMRAFVVRYEKQKVFSGTVLLACHGQIVFEQAFGMANYELGVANQTAQKFRVASVSKEVTQVAIATLVDSGKLRLDARLSEFLPAFPRASEITIRQLLNHRAGVVHINNLPWYERESRFFHTVNDLLDRIAREPLVFEPGARYQYSNGGYVLLARVIELVSGQQYGDYLRAHVFGPAGMNDSGHEPGDIVLSNRAYGYTLGTSGLVPASYFDPSIKIGGGSVYTTALDMYRWHQAVMKGKIVSAPWRDSIVSLIDSPIGPRRWYGGGRQPGFTASVQYYPDTDASVIVLSNNYARVAEEIADGLAGFLFGTSSHPRVALYHDRKPIAAVRLNEAQLRRFEGRWLLGSTAFEIRQRDGELFWYNPERFLEHRMLVTSTHQLVDPLLWQMLEFSGSESGPFSQGEAWSLDFPMQFFPNNVNRLTRRNNASPQSQAGNCADTIAVRRALTQADQAFSAAYVAGKFQEMANMYTTDGMLLPTGRVIRGRADIEQFFTYPATTKQIAHQLTMEELRVEGCRAIEIGTFTSTKQRADQPASTGTGKYLLVWRRQSNGQWLIEYDMWH